MSILMLVVYRKKPADSPVSESVVFDSDTYPGDIYYLNI